MFGWIFKSVMYNVKIFVGCLSSVAVYDFSRSYTDNMLNLDPDIERTSNTAPTNTNQGASNSNTDLVDTFELFKTYLDGKKFYLTQRFGLRNRLICKIFETGDVRKTEGGSGYQKATQTYSR